MKCCDDFMAALGRAFGWDEEKPTEILYIPFPPLPAPVAPKTVTSAPLPSNSTPMTIFPQLIIKWSLLIGAGEGATPASHNPGNLKYSSLTASWGATPGRAATDGGHLCQFASDDAGYTALRNFLMLGCENQLIAFHTISAEGKPQPWARTLAGFTKIYAGNPPQPYIDRIVNGLGVSPTVDISTFLKA